MAADRLRRRGIPAQTLLAIAALLSVAAQFALILRWPLPTYLSWSIVAAVGAATVLSFAALAEHFPRESIGQANGALNVLHLAGAFVAQSGIGLVVQQWGSVDGRYPAIAYQVALSVNLVLQVAALFWCIRPERCAPRKPPVVSATALAFPAAVAIEPVTVDQRAAQAWDDRLGSAAAQAANWRFAAIGSTVLSALLGLTLGIAATRADAVVYRVDIGAPAHEHVTAAANEPTRASDAQIAYVLARFIEHVRSLSRDPIVVRSNWQNAYAHLTDRGAEELNSYARAADVFAKIGKQTVSVEVISVVRAADRRFAIRWVESTYENGLQIAADRFSGVIEIVFEPGRTLETLLANPLGLYVHSIAWSHA
jgi:type IV secretion system protein VirB5